MIDFSNRVLMAQIKHADAMIEKHKINVEVLTKNASGVADHPDMMQTVEDELNKIGHWEEIKSVIRKHFDFEGKRTLTE
jgi:hypothetical protein